ncbi:MAG: hypothetical protein LBD36_02995 [Holosporales bacterium]|jgi:hypothetical protein|nr:hypothetical protein [Holosporales bacterium]
MHCKLFIKLSPIILLYSPLSATTGSGTKVIQQIKDVMYDILTETRVITTDAATFAPVHEAIGFTATDISTGGSIKARLENLTTVVANDSCKISQLQTRLDQYNVERRRDMNTLVALQAQIMEQNRRTESLLLSVAQHILFFLDNESHGVEDLIYAIRSTQDTILESHVQKLDNTEAIYSGKQLKPPKPHHSCYRNRLGPACSTVDSLDEDASDDVSTDHIIPEDQSDLLFK